MIYGREIFIRAHQDPKIPYYNHSYNREVRGVSCAACGSFLGEQYKYEMDNNFHFYDYKEKNDFKYCPYCGHKFIQR